MSKKKYPRVHRRLETPAYDYIVMQVGPDHFELTCTSALNERVTEAATIFNSAQEADAGLLDRACTR